MIWYKRKDGSVFGKDNPSKEQQKTYKKQGCVECDESGNKLSKKSKPKK
tara:strand:+ start:3121 stop:3267 length:147 start_codon:yes stop_codon:yes gene_type:complete